MKYSNILNNQRGAALVFVAFAIIMLLSLAALAIDISHLVVTKNELQNAADAGALAGARFLYTEDGTSVREDANEIACNTAKENVSDRVAVDVNWTSGNSGDVQRGHWSFTKRTFTPNDSTIAVNLSGGGNLDTDEDFINAVRVIARRESTPVSSFFARIFGFDSFIQSATAVAYRGFAGSLGKGEVDLPIAICEESILNEDKDYDCNMGRMINSGSNTETSNTGGWTNFTQPCDTADANTMNGLICAGGNPKTLNFNSGMGSTGGEQQSTFDSLIECWKKTDNAGDSPKNSWEVTLPVVSCPGNNVSNCAVLKGAVNLNIVWIERKGNDYKDVPKEMDDWSSADDYDLDVIELKDFFVGQKTSDLFPTFPEGTKVGAVFGDDTIESGKVRWASFVKRFKLKNVGNPAPYASFAQKSIYFLPDCTLHEPKGGSQGKNFGILAKYPVLVD